MVLAPGVGVALLPMTATGQLRFLEIDSIPGANGAADKSRQSPGCPGLEPIRQRQALLLVVGLVPGHENQPRQGTVGQDQTSGNWVRQALKMAAMSLSHSDCALGAFYCRLSGRTKKQPTNTATAHKLASMVYFMLNPA